MSFRRSVLASALVVMLAGMMTRSANATSFSQVVVYGDSLSDNGNLYAAEVKAGITPLEPPSPPYYNGRFSNGPVAVEQLAATLGVPLTDFAFTGATSGIGNYADGGTQTATGTYGLPGMLAELAGSASFLSTVNPATALFVVWGGSNDFLAGGSVTTGVADIDFIVSSLLADGAQHVLVPGIPDLGLTPDYYGDPTATLFAETFNTLLQATLPAGATYVDTFNLLQSVNKDPGAYGFTDATDPCLNTTLGTVCSDPSKYVFWDGFHPTTTADALLAQDFLAAAETPEPASILLMGSGLSGLALMVRARRRR